MSRRIGPNNNIIAAYYVLVLPLRLCLNVDIGVFGIELSPIPNQISIENGLQYQI